jgi:hypothetical protein
LFRATVATAGSARMLLGDNINQVRGKPRSSARELLHPQALGR